MAQDIAPPNPANLFNIGPDAKKPKLELTEEEKKQLELDEENAELEKLGESLWLTDMFCVYPKTVIFLGLVVIIGFTLLTFFLESYMPSPITNRDLLDYEDINTKMFDAREAATAEIQEKSTPNGEIPLQSITKQDWWLNIGVECIREGCDNILTPEGLKLLSKIDELVESDPLWPKVCLHDSP